jgi:hypothetical protein
MHINNFLWNMPIIHRYPGILKFERIFPNYPSVLVGAGPSLDKHITLLTNYRKHFILLCVDAALPVLIQNNITPDIVCVVDPTEKQADNFVNIDTTKFITLVPPVAHPRVFRMISPIHTLVYNIKDPKSPIMEQAPYHTGMKGALPAGVLTSGTCVGFSSIMGCNPVVFVGHDLSWPTPDKVYAKGIKRAKEDFQKGAKFRGGCLLFPDIYGNLVLTHNTFLNFWAWHRDLARNATNKYINCSEAGILLHKYMRAMPLKRCIDRHMSKQLTGISERLNHTYMESRAPGGMVEKLLCPKWKKKIKV